MKDNFSSPPDGPTFLIRRGLIAVITVLLPGGGVILISPLQSGARTVSRTRLAKTGEAVNVKDFGATGDGLTNDRAAIQAAFNASKKVHFQAGIYYVGTLSNGSTALDLRTLGGGISITTDGFVELLCETTNDSQTSFFAMNENSDFYCDPIHFRDTGFITNQASPKRGATGFLVLTGSTSWGKLRFAGIYGNKIFSAFEILNVGNTNEAKNRVSNIVIDDVAIDEGYYGVALGANGDNTSVKKITTSRVFRSLFVYNVVNVEALIYATNHLATSGVVNIGRFNRNVTTSPTKAIRVRYVSRGNANALTHVLINHIGPDTGVIDGVTLELDIEDNGTPQHAVRCVTYNTSGGSEIAASLGNVVANISINGRVTNNWNDIGCHAN